MELTPTACATETLVARDLSVRLGPATTNRVLFKGVDLALRPAEVCDLTGPSGSGKTTLLCALARLHPYASGMLVLEGRDSSTITPQHWRTHVALLPQKAAFVSGTVRDNFLLAFGFADKAQAAKPGDEDMLQILEQVGLGSIELDHSIDRLSVGQAARVALCRTLLTKPDVLLLDEVDAALDAESVKMIGELTRRYVNEQCRTCLRIRHREPDEYTTRSLVFAGGMLTEAAAEKQVELS